MLNVEIWPQISTGGKVLFSLPFTIYFTLETKSEFSTTRVEKSIEDNFYKRHPVLIK